MKVTQHRHDVERTGVTGEKEFQIRTTAQAFDILSSGIYSDPVMAVIRELSCNAFDSHVEAGKQDVPFEVHLPSKLEPWFSVTDHGIGLSDEQTRGLYTTYFESTKRDTNDQIGAFGLGSKSPFSYTKSFDVIVNFDGKKRTYNVFLNEDGVPTIATLATVKTNEENGIMVKFAVRDQDFHLFREKTAQVLRYFPVHPTIVGSAGFEFAQKPKKAIDGDGYYVWNKDNWGKSITAVQGNVPYKVESDHLQSKMSRELSEFLDEYAFVGYFDIGQLDVAASREEVRYDERTVDNLIAKLELARTDFLKRLDKDISALTKSGSTWEVFALLTSRFRYTNSVKKIAGNHKFKSKLFNEWIEKDGHVDIVPGDLYTVKSYRSGQGRAVPQTLAERNYTDAKGTTIRVKTERPEDHVVVMLNDVSKRSSIRINNYIKNNSDCREVLAIAPKSDRVLTNSGIAVPTKKQRDDAYEAILKKMGNPTILTLSEETEDVTVQGKPRTGGNTFKIFKPNSYSRSDRVKPIFDECQEPDKGIYMEMTILRDTIINGEKVNWNHQTFKKYVETMLDVINHVKQTKYTIEDVHGLTKKVVKAVSGNPDWHSITELYHEAVDDLHETMEVHNRIEATDDDIGICRQITRTDFQNMVAKLPATSHFRTTVEPAIEAAKKANAAKKAGIDESTIRQIDLLNNMMNIKFKKMSKTPFFKSADFAEYDMLHLSGISLGQHRKAEQILIDYINLIES